jgi:predicted GTPase
MTQGSKVKKILTADLRDLFRTKGLSDAEIQGIEEKLDEISSFSPTIGIFGKTGTGKSSLCNAIFGKETAKVSDVDACTREPQKIFVELTKSGDGITLIDLPGVGENGARDLEYEQLYREWLPQIDLILWVIRCDDRTFTPDEHFYNSIVKPELTRSPKPFIVVVNQVDRTNPIREWNERSREPGPNQRQAIGERIQWAASQFGINKSNVVSVSCVENYHIHKLVETIINAVPDKQKFGFINNVKEDVVSPLARESALHGTIEFLKEAYQEIKPYIPTIIAGIKWLWNTFKS